MNLLKILLAGYILFWIGIAIMSVGEMPASLSDPNPKPYSIALPFLMAITIGFPAFVGYLIGKGEPNNG